LPAMLRTQRVGEPRKTSCTPSSLAQAITRIKGTSERMSATTCQGQPAPAMEVRMLIQLNAKLPVSIHRYGWSGFFFTSNGPPGEQSSIHESESGRFCTE